jgi:glycosyltransferase involved in cell wall biosynthesis
MDRTESPQDDVRTEMALAAGTADVTVGIPTWNRSGLLRKAIESVLAQSYPHFTLLVSDNASDDDTAATVASFDDPRVIYRPLETNIGRTANFNRVIELAETEFVLILGDDDELQPDHLSRLLEELKRRPNVGVGHTGYEIVDEQGNVLAPHAPPPYVDGPIVFETGSEYLERNMTSGPEICISSTVFRKAALENAGRLRIEDGVIDDFPLLMRIAGAWDFLYVNAPLALLRTHEGASSSSLGEFTPRGFRSSRSLPDILYQHRLKCLTEAHLPPATHQSLARKARRSHRRDLLAHLSMRARTGDGVIAPLKALGAEIRRDRRLAVDPLTWRFVAGQFGGRRVGDRVREAVAARR